ncbi:TrmH family RNA methyltransferase [Candidatus Enterococcus ferrettii]|uniref:TrmH family RNA methyltransferase n=1 Tax=Candidatus Enterococcus ferrettii TaxID=2815324 RepID=A0ABV0EVR6_9ENTE|nr:RNA methyltransferase [Enterococcus sp. 665A]MBO1342504.1 RNA methyltransferase [Enterococcus sp. 665A]
MKEIQSNKNPFIKEIKKLQQKKYRQQTNSYILEGFHLVQEAFNAGVEIQEVFVNPRGQKEWAAWLAERFPEYYLVSDEILKMLADQPTPQGMAAVVSMTEDTIEQFTGAWLLLDQVQDPGNVGTMIRTADAAGFSGVVLGEGTVDLYNPKTLRSMQGSHFHLAVVSRKLPELISELQSQKFTVFGTALDKNAKNYQTVDVQADFALVMGNEGQGMRPDLLAMTDANLYIPIKGQAESLNVAVAAGILMFKLIK